MDAGKSTKKRKRLGRLCVDVGAALNRQIETSRKANGRTKRGEVELLLRDGYKFREGKT